MCIFYLKKSNNSIEGDEGTVNYCPQIALDNEETLGTAVEIPPPITRPTPDPAEFSKENNPFIYFDL